MSKPLKWNRFLRVNKASTTCLGILLERANIEESKSNTAWLPQAGYPYITIQVSKAWVRTEVHVVLQYPWIFPRFPWNSLCATRSDIGLSPKHTVQKSSCACSGRQGLIFCNILHAWRASSNCNKQETVLSSKSVNCFSAYSPLNLSISCFLASLSLLNLSNALFPTFFIFSSSTTYISCKDSHPRRIGHRYSAFL